MESCGIWCQILIFPNVEFYLCMAFDSRYPIDICASPNYLSWLWPSTLRGCHYMSLQILIFCWLHPKSLSYNATASMCTTAVADLRGLWLWPQTWNLRRQKANIFNHVWQSWRQPDGLPAAISGHRCRSSCLSIDDVYTGGPSVKHVRR